MSDLRIDKVKVDMWAHRDSMMVCTSCMWFSLKVSYELDGDLMFFGRCRRHAPTLSGFPAVYGNDWCGDHKMSEDYVWCDSKGIAP